MFCLSPYGGESGHLPSETRPRVAEQQRRALSPVPFLDSGALAGAPSLESALDRIADHAVGGPAAIVLLGNVGDCWSRSLEGQPRS